MSKIKNKSKRLKKYHKWPGLILSFILIYYAVSGILMNHRDLISGVDINRHSLPQEYSYNNWNLAALKGNQTINNDSILVYGNIGIWLTDSTFQNYTDFNLGFPNGVDNRKIFDVHLTPKNNLYAATLFGLFHYNKNTKLWQKVNLNTEIERFVSVISKGDSIIAMNRSFIFAGIDNGLNTKLEKIELKAPVNYENNISLFKTIWQIHSGEVFGLPGKLFVDFMGLLVIMLSVTGIIYFFFPRIMKRRKRKEKAIEKLSLTNKLSLKWHNKIGAWFIVFLVILTLSGMFLRPPLLLTIARADIPALKFTHLDQANPWYDDLRDILYDTETDKYILAGYNGLYELDNLTSVPKFYNSQPPVSVMGINVFEKFNSNTYLIGSFSGLFLWNIESSLVFDFISGKPHQSSAMGRPFGSYAISGIIKNKEQSYIIDYSKGIFTNSSKSNFPEMPIDVLDNSPMSLWSLCLEIHTGRIFHFALSNFYILIVPLSGIASLIVIISGYLLYRKRKKTKRQSQI
jgi:hypothetical protein